VASVTGVRRAVSTQPVRPGSGGPAGCCPPVRCPVTPGRRPGVRRSSRPMSSRPMSTPLCPVASVSSHLRRWRWDQVEAAGTRHHRNRSRPLWRPHRRWTGSPAEEPQGRATPPSSRGGQSRVGGGPGSGLGRAAAAARARCATRQARPACGASVAGGGPGTRRELAAPAVWLPWRGWVGDHGGWCRGGGPSG
jgi:hypothetical protein